MTHKALPAEPSRRIVSGEDARFIYPFLGMLRWKLLDPAENAADAVQAHRWGFLESVLPDADDLPSLKAELAVDAVDALAAGKWRPSGCAGSAVYPNLPRGSVLSWAMLVSPLRSQKARLAFGRV